MRNCTMVGNSLVFTPSTSYTPAFTVLDSAFDGVAFQFSGTAANSTYATYDYNTYTNASNPFPLGGSHNVIVTNSFNWQVGSLGNFYLPTDSTLIDVGSQTADLAGLYHFTTQTNQVEETNSVVDIGYHYVADADWDGLPDAWELEHFGNLNQTGADDFDGDGLSNFLEYVWGHDPTQPDTSTDWDGDHLPDFLDADPYAYDTSEPAFVITAPAIGSVY
jgi:hypothetical protein